MNPVKTQHILPFSTVVFHILRHINLDRETSLSAFFTGKVVDIYSKFDVIVSILFIFNSFIIVGIGEHDVLCIYLSFV